MENDPQPNPEASPEFSPPPSTPPASASLPPPPPPYGYGTVNPLISERDIRLWSMLCHLAALCTFLVPLVGGAVGPLVVWLLKRNDHPTIDANGKESLNFQISMLIYYLVLGGIGALTLFILVGFLFLALGFLVWLVAIVMAIIASIKVSNGETFRYPLTIRFIN
jgi:uncharacterized Tic20 family protein